MTEPRRHYATSVAQLAELLGAQVESLAAELLPAGRRDGPEWCVGSTAGEPGQSLRVRLTGARRGVWADFSSADRRDRGDALDLVAAVLFAGDKVAAIRWARGWLGLATDYDHNAMQTQRPAPVQKLASERDESGKRVAAARLWHEAAELRGSPAAAYLAGRGLDLAELGRVPRALRFHPSVICAELSCSRTQERIRLPAMLAAITDAEGRHIATHRTYLAERQAGGWEKARLRTPKKVLGGYVGGTIRLWRGASGKPLADAPAGDVVAIAEGIEDGLTVARACPEWRVLSAISVSNFANIALPAACAEVVLIRDRDAAGSQADQAAAKAVRRWQGEGRRVREAMPPGGHKDFNDWWQAQRAGRMGSPA